MLSPKQLKAIEALVTSATMVEAIAKAGISPDTLYRWLADDEFRGEWYAVVRLTYEKTLRDAQYAAAEALAKILELMRKGSPQVAIRAAERILDVATRAAELLDLQGDLAELKRRLDGDTSDPKGNDAAAKPRI